MPCFVFVGVWTITVCNTNKLVCAMFIIIMCVVNYNLSNDTKV